MDTSNKHSWFWELTDGNQINATVRSRGVMLIYTGTAVKCNFWPTFARV